MAGRRGSAGRGGEHERGEHDGQEAAHDGRHVGQPIGSRSGRGPGELRAVRRVGAGALAGEGRDLDGAGHGLAQVGLHGEPGATQSALDPAREESAAEGVARADRVDHRDDRNGDLEGAGRV